MAQRTDERAKTPDELEVYTKALKLSDHILSVCKPRDNKPNNHHIPKRNAGIGRMMMDDVVAIGADILEANNIYVGTNIDDAVKLEHYENRIALQEHAKKLTFRIEHIFKVLHFDQPFAESTCKYMMDLLTETRELLTNWRESELRTANALKKKLSVL